MLTKEGISLDEFGPERIIVVQDPKTGMKGVTVIDNTARGPGKGGMRFVPDVSVVEVARLARAMTWKNAIADLPFGGAKSGILGDPRKVDRQAFVRAFASKIKNVIPELYIAGPDMNTTEREMAAFADEVGTPDACTGKPSEMGGLPHELGSTGWGVAQSTFVALEHKGIDVPRANAAIEGFGNVGVFTARFLSAQGVRIVAVSDSKGTVYNPKGLDVAKLEAVKQKEGSVTAFKDGKKLAAEDLFGLDVDVLIPGARPDVITDKNKGKIKAKIIVEAANIPIVESVEKELDKKGILIVPDFIANAGGVISSYVETIHGTPEQMFSVVKEKVSRNTRIVLERAREEKKWTREAALEIAKERVVRAMDLRGWR